MLHGVGRRGARGRAVVAEAEVVVREEERQLAPPGDDLRHADVRRRGAREDRGARGGRRRLERGARRRRDLGQVQRPRRQAERLRNEETAPPIINRQRDVRRRGRPPLALVGREQVPTVRGAGARPGELPGQVVRVAHGRVHAEAAARRHLVRGVADEERPVAVEGEAVRQARAHEPGPRALYLQIGEGRRRQRAHLAPHVPGRRGVAGPLRGREHGELEVEEALVQIVGDDDRRRLLVEDEVEHRRPRAEPRREVPRPERDAHEVLEGRRVEVVRDARHAVRGVRGGGEHDPRRGAARAVRGHEVLGVEGRAVVEDAGHAVTTEADVDDAPAVARLDVRVGHGPAQQRLEHGLRDVLHALVARRLEVRPGRRGPVVGDGVVGAVDAVAVAEPPPALERRRDLPQGVAEAQVLADLQRARRQHVRARVRRRRRPRLDERARRAGAAERERGHEARRAAAADHDLCRDASPRQGHPQHAGLAVVWPRRAVTRRTCVARLSSIDSSHCLASCSLGAFQAAQLLAEAGSAWHFVRLKARAAHVAGASSDLAVALLAFALFDERAHIADRLGHQSFSSPAAAQHSQRQER